MSLHAAWHTCIVAGVTAVQALQAWPIPSIMTVPAMMIACMDRPQLDHFALGSILSHCHTGLSLCWACKSASELIDKKLFFLIMKEAWMSADNPL